MVDVAVQGFWFFVGRTVPVINHMNERLQLAR